LKGFLERIEEGIFRGLGKKNFMEFGKERLCGIEEEDFLEFACFGRCRS
jgi:hypothetical protein